MSTETSDLPKLSKPAQRALAVAGLLRLEQIAAVSEADLLKLHGVGPHSIAPLREALAAKGLAFAAPKHDLVITRAELRKPTSDRYGASP